MISINFKDRELNDVSQERMIEEKDSPCLMIIFWNILIVSRAMVWELFLFPSDRGSDIALLELTNQVALLQ